MSFHRLVMKSDIRKISLLFDELSKVFSVNYEHLQGLIAKKDVLIKQQQIKLQSTQASITNNDNMDVFSDIYNLNTWHSKESVSGEGSEVKMAEGIINQLPQIIGSLNAKSILDIPCGDFNWMKLVDLDGINYVGGDIVPEIVNQNLSFSKDAISFEVIDITTSKLPSVDIIFVRDCLVHFSFWDILRALKNICQSDIKYLMMTHFLYLRENIDIITGKWRTLNFNLPPFCLPGPEKILIEGCTQGNFQYTDKCLGVWEVEKIRSLLKEMEKKLDSSCNNTNQD